MFYIKTKISEDVTLHVEINGENVFTTCPVCGQEHQVDIVELATTDPKFDLYGSSILCRECTEKRWHRKALGEVSST